MTFALLLIAARVVIIDNDIEVPAGKSHAHEFDMRHHIGTVDCSFKVLSSGAGVRVMLMTKPELEKLNQGTAYSALEATSYVRDGRFSHRVKARGEYAVVLDNRFEGRGPARVHLKIEVDHSAYPAVTPRYAPKSTRMTVIILSTLFFLAVSTYFAKRFAG
jgi:hypothetical protein